MTTPLPEIQKIPASHTSTEKQKEVHHFAMNGIVAGFVAIALLTLIGGILFLRFPGVFLGMFSPRSGEVLQDPILGDIALTREVSALGSPITPVAGFSVDDSRYFLTIRASDVPAPTEISVRWYEGSVLIGETAKSVEADQWISFSFEPATPHATTYRLEISRDGIRKTSLLFSVVP